MSKDFAEKIIDGKTYHIVQDVRSYASIFPLMFGLDFAATHDVEAIISEMESWDELDRAAFVTDEMGRSDLAAGKAFEDRLAALVDRHEC